ncbi:MAG: carbohydrate ABC transporter permease [Anaerolineae bacterium]|nr:carbohydrate ABC transporter permease [Anaerolineae bacterium]
MFTFLIPTLWMVVSSLKASTEIFSHPIVWIPKDPQWRNYVRAFQELPLERFAWNSFVVVVGAVVGTVISSALVGFSFARLRWPGRDFLFSLVVATLLLPGVVLLIPRFVIFRNLDWINTYLPLIVPFWLGGSPFYIFLMRQFIRGLPKELDDAALIDGANRFQIFARIILPLCKPVIATVTVFSLLEHYNAFLEPLIYLNSMDMWTLPIGIRGLNDAYAANWELVFAASTVMMIPMVLLFIFAQRYFVRGIATTGLKG